ncbi:chemotaxis protein CheB [Aquimonas sp.]|jgi:two-component system CheB/CheR fusion protein|uniref:chemotaxis protein CheB n=1 Tax=Aquimonas sp. TaxID=1872588 RepID=UPI0037C124A4
MPASGPATPGALAEAPVLGDVLPARVRVVGIGASAGGLQALELFLAAVPADSGLAFIVVQHLDPTQKALLPELLQRITPMPVREAADRMRIAADCVYVIPPNTELSLAGASLKLAPPAEPRGLRLPVNVLFSSLASVQGEQAVAVVLSGMGSDGTLGMQAIKAVGGLTAAQEPASAQFDSMPSSAIAAGCADIVAPPEELPSRILAVLMHASTPRRSPKAETPASPEAAPFKQIIELLRQRTRHDFTLYKVSTLQRRIERRMAIHAIDSVDAYAEFLESNAQETDLLFKELLIGVTSFFRDAPVWEYLAGTALPELLARRGDEQHLRVWSVGCSTGEEAYSLAIAFAEAFDQLPEAQAMSLQIFASDISPDAIGVARRGRYPLSIADSVSAPRLARFFVAHPTYYEISKSIRDRVLFAQHDVALDPPFTRLDLIVCRNLLIYFVPELQRKLLPLFHYSLRRGGLLLLGSSETVGRLTRLFTPLHARLRLYERQEDGAIRGANLLLKSFPPLRGTSKEPPMSAPQTPEPSNDGLQRSADDVLLQNYAPAAVVINGEGDIVYISGRTGNYLEPAAGKANWNIHAMARDGLRAPLVEALRGLAERNEPLQLHELQVQTGAGTQVVDVTLQAFQEPAALRGMSMLVFRDAPAAPAGRARRPKGALSASHEAELRQCHDEIRNLREEARASREELQSSNEELQSTNEELQSANEELTTSKEEMQSMNEELQTINSELQTKLDDLALAQSDMKNVLNSIEIAILFLDQQLNVRRYTDRAAKLVNLRESDIGRPLSDITSSLQYPALHEDALETLHTLLPSEKQIRTDDGRQFQVRVMPYRRIDNMIDGVVITLLDLTKAPRAS